MSFQGFLPSLPTFSPLRIPVLTTCFSESNFNRPHTQRESKSRAKNANISFPEKSTVFKPKVVISDQTKLYDNVRRLWWLYLEYAGFYYIFFCPHQHSGHSATTVLSRFSRFFGGDQKCLSANGENIKWTQSRF